MTNPIVVMGVSGAGKSTLARALAEALGWAFVEGDLLHSPANIVKMAAGTPLDDADRQPFLENVARTIVEGRNAGVVVSCSALKRTYRDLIRARAGDVTFVLPLIDREHLVARLAARQGHFMPSSLIDSQLDTLQMPDADEHAIVVDGNVSTPNQVMRVLAALE